MEVLGVIFDMDGVLVDSAEPHYESWRLLAREIDREMPEPLFRETFGRQNRDIIPRVFGIEDEATVQRLGDRKEVLYREIIRRRVPEMDGAGDLVRACHDAGFKLAVGSSGPRENVELVLEGMGIAAMFDVRITHQQVTRGKPDPEVFQLAAAGLEIPPVRCAVIEDAPAGVEAALACGAAAIGIAGTHAAEALARAHLVVASPSELSPGRIRDLIMSRDGST